jgi:hypothetical protein
MRGRVQKEPGRHAQNQRLELNLHEQAIVEEQRRNHQYQTASGTVKYISTASEQWNQQAEKSDISSKICNQTALYSFFDYFKSY